MLEKKIAEDPKDPRLHGPLGIAYAGLGRRDDAIREAALTIEIHGMHRGHSAGWRFRVAWAVLPRRRRSTWSSMSPRPIPPGGRN
ncbi:MAG: hypothetical protein IH926_10735 [Proteobacteria bacterium]|nr:hypothetical protein [Pseudomonadota bacterium]